jgi:hypothetical protein
MIASLFQVDGTGIVLIGFGRAELAVIGASFPDISEDQTIPSF